MLLHLQCEWLLGDRKPSPEELDKGIDPDSPLFQAILDNPVVQLGLTNPKTLLGTCLLYAYSWVGRALTRRCLSDIAVGVPRSSPHLHCSILQGTSCLSHSWARRSIFSFKLCILTASLNISWFSEQRD